MHAFIARTLPSRLIPALIALCAVAASASAVASNAWIDDAADEIASSMVVYSNGVTVTVADAVKAQGAPPAEQPATPSSVEGIDLRGGRTKFPLRWFLHAVAQVEGYRFIVEEAVYTGMKDVMIISRVPDGEGDTGLFIPAKAFFSVLQAMLKTQRLILVPFGENSDTSLQFYEVLPTAQAITSSRAEDVVVLDSIDQFRGDGAGFVTLIAPMKYADVTIVRTAIAPFHTREAVVAPIQGLNALLMADYASNVKRIAKIISLLDVASDPPRIEIVPVEHLDAEELAVSIDEILNNRNQLLTQAGRPGQPGGSTSDPNERVTISLPPSLNGLMLLGYDKGIALVKELIKKLDVKVPGSEQVTGRIHIYRARNVQAADLADALNALLRDGSVSFGASSSTAPDPNTGQLPPPQPPAANRLLQDQTPVIEFYENTNALLIIARPSVYTELLKLIDQLDQRRHQVMIEAAILEVRRDDDFTFGVEVASIDGAGNGVRINAGTSFGFSNIVDSTGVPVDTAGGEPAGRTPIFGTGGIFTLTKGGPFNIPLLIRFLKQQTDVNILSVPRVMANDNEESSIEILTEIPTSSLNTVGTGNVTTSGQQGFEEDGITLTVTPRINEDNYIVLNIDLDVKAFIGQPAQPGLSPPRTSRRIRTTVTVPNGQTVVIGGLTSNTSSRAVSKVPFLGDVPFLGELFKSETTQDRQTNLYIFVRPEIFRDASFRDLLDRSQKDLVRAKGEVLDTPASSEFLKKSMDANEAADASSLPGVTPKRLIIEELPPAK